MPSIARPFAASLRALRQARGSLIGSCWRRRSLLSSRDCASTRCSGNAEQPLAGPIVGRRMLELQQVLDDAHEGDLQRITAAVGQLLDLLGQLLEVQRQVR